MLPSLYFKHDFSSTFSILLTQTRACRNVCDRATFVTAEHGGFPGKSHVCLCLGGCYSTGECTVVLLRPVGLKGQEAFHVFVAPAVMSEVLPATFV